MAPLVVGLDGPARPPPVSGPAADEDDTPLSITLTAMTPVRDPAQGSDHAHGAWSPTPPTSQWTDINVFAVHRPGADHHPRRARRGRRDRPRQRRRRPADRPGHLRDGGRARARATARRSRSGCRSRHCPSPVTRASTGSAYTRWAPAWTAATRSPTGAHARSSRSSRPQIARERTVPVSVVLPLRDRARRDADGSLNGPTRWVNLTRSDGRLTRLADFGASAGDAPVSWLVDVAVLDALSDFANGNPPLSLGPALDARGRDGRRRRTAATEDPDDPDASPGEPDAGVERGSLSECLDPAPARAPRTQATRERTRSVLETFLSSTRKNPVLALGYADPDVVALARLRPSLIRRSDDLAARRMVAWGLERQAGRGTAQRLLRPRPPHRDPPGLVDARSPTGTAAEPGAVQPPVRPPAPDER